MNSLPNLVLIRAGQRYWGGTNQLPRPHKIVYLSHYRSVQILTKPHHARSLKPLIARRALGDILLGDVLNPVVRVQQRELLSRRHVHGGGGESRAERVIVIVILNPVAGVIGTLDVEQGAVEGAQLLRWVVCPLRKVFGGVSASLHVKTEIPLRRMALTINILRQA